MPFLKFSLLLLTTAESPKVYLYIPLQILTCGNSQDHLKTTAIYSTYSTESGQTQRTKDSNSVGKCASLLDPICSECWSHVTVWCLVVLKKTEKNRFKEADKAPRGMSLVFSALDKHKFSLRLATDATPLHNKTLKATQKMRDETRQECRLKRKEKQFCSLSCTHKNKCLASFS
jgi:hypothetical protein